MLVSFPSELIFLKTKKTAGTTVEATLQRDIFNVALTHAQGWDIHRDGFVTPRLRDASVSLAQWPILLESAARWRFNPLKIRSLRNHSTPEDVISALGEGIFASLTKVTCVRNPFDLMVSKFFWRVSKKPNPPSFREWALRQPRGAINGQIVQFLDESWRIIRHERLESDLLNLYREFEFAHRGDIPKFKSEHRPRVSGDYRSLYDGATRRHVEYLYADWLEAFDYEF